MSGRQAQELERDNRILGIDVDPNSERSRRQASRTRSQSHSPSRQSAQRIQPPPTMSTMDTDFKNALKAVLSCDDDECDMIEQCRVKTLQRLHTFSTRHDFLDLSYNDGTNDIKLPSAISIILHKFRNYTYEMTNNDSTWNLSKIVKKDFYEWVGKGCITTFVSDPAADKLKQDQAAFKILSMGGGGPQFC